MRPMLVFDATPLIYLAKAGVLDTLSFLETDNVVVSGVYREVVEQGIQRGADDAEVIRKSLAHGLLKIENIILPFSFLQDNKKLSSADKEALYFCHKRKNAVLLADDEEIRKIAEMESIPNHGSVYVLFSLLRRKRITKEELRNVLHKMITAGWYCSIDFYTEIMNQLEKE